MAKGYSDPTSEAQIKVIEAVLTEHRALYEKVSRLRDAEQGKEFELPEPVSYTHLTLPTIYSV